MGDGGSIVATSLTMSSKVGAQTKTSPSAPSEKTPHYQRIKDSSAEEEPKRAVDYVSRAALKTEERVPASEHTKSHSDDCSEGNAKGKYGSVWKTPQNQHTRARSANFSNVLQNWEDRESTTNENKSLREENEAELSAANKKFDLSTTPDHPSLLRSLQNTQSNELRSKNLEKRNSADNYEKLWLSESNSQSKVNPEMKSAGTAQYK